MTVRAALSVTSVRAPELAITGKPPPEFTSASPPVGNADATFGLNMLRPKSTPQRAVRAKSHVLRSAAVTTMGVCAVIRIPSTS
jgi:hypothetical protein